MGSKSRISDKMFITEPNTSNYRVGDDYSINKN